MPTITLPDTYDPKLKALVTEPFADTRESIIRDLIDKELARRNLVLNGNGHVGAGSGGIRRLNPDSPEDLSFTRVRSATVDGREINRPKWNSVMDEMHILGLKRLKSFDALKQASRAKVRQGRFEEDGYKYLADADLSIQGVGSDLAWSNSLRLARALRVPIRLSIEWRDVEGAAHPGETAVLEWTPTPAQSAAAGVAPNVADTGRAADRGSSVID